MAERPAFLLASGPRGIVFAMRYCLAVTALLALAMPAHADGDAELGKKVFAKCSACHDAKTEQNRVGPHLVGVVGRPAASVQSFKYSDAMTAAGVGGLIWDEATLTKYLRAPKAVVPGTKMVFAGLKKDEDIANVIAWLKADPKP